MLLRIENPPGPLLVQLLLVTERGNAAECVLLQMLLYRHLLEECISFFI